MNLFELIKYRRSIRKYEERQIPREDLERIIEAGLYAPNAGGGQRSMIVALRDLPLDEEKKDYDDILEKFFEEHPQVHHCITFNSKAHLVGMFLQKTNRRNIQIMGYDMVPKNVECIHNGSISFLIAQHAYQQGYASVDALFNAIVMKRQVNPVNYMPIEILTKENVDFYRRTAI